MSSDPIVLAGLTLSQRDFLSFLARQVDGAATIAEIVKHYGDPNYHLCLEIASTLHLAALVQVTHPEFVRGRQRVIDESTVTVTDRGRTFVAGDAEGDLA
jgi:hypothetical protein